MLIMQNVGKTSEGDTNKDLKTANASEGSPEQTSSTTGVENFQGSTQSNFMPDMSGSDEEEASEVESFILDPEEMEDGDQMIEASQFLLPAESMEGADLRTVDPETHARLEALLEAAGIGKLSTADGKALTDPEVLRKLTSSVSCALDEAAAALTRMRAEQQGQLAANAESSRSLAEACCDGDVGTVRRMLDEGGSVNETTEEGESLLSLACSAGYYELAQVLLAMKANVEDRGIKGDCTPLMEAASGGYVDIVRLLMTHGADVNAQSSAGNTPLHYAAAGGYEDVVQVLIESGANVEEHNENGHTPLMEAASAGHVGVARILLNAGAGINTHSNEFKESALTLACYKGHLEMVKFLLEAGADQEHKTDEMHTALMEASMDGHVEVARLLLDSGAQVNMPADSFESPLTLAACGGHVDLANLLIERGANLEEVNDEGYTPLMEAAREGHEEMVALLLAHGADINAQTEETQETALTLACCGGFLEVGDFLIKAGADIELGCSTPLMEAAQEGHLELVKYLLKAGISGANVHAQTQTGDTALTYACENGHTDVAEVLLESGAELEHESEGGRTPLMKAARAGHYSTVQFLITKGADVNRQTSTNDHTVLSLACAGGHLSVVELLLGHGADPTHKLKDGSTMIIEAAKGGHTQVVNLLLEWPNGMFMAPSPDICQVTPMDPHFSEPRVPVHGLNNIVPPSDPDPNPLVVGGNPSAQAAVASEVRNKLLGAKDLLLSAGKSMDQVTKSLQKTLGKRPASSLAGSIEDLPKANKNCTLGDGMEDDGGKLIGDKLTFDGGTLADWQLLPQVDANLKASEKLDAIISNMMKDPLLSASGSPEEQIQQRQQILEELQKVERELQEKAQAQLELSVQHRAEQQQIQMQAVQQQQQQHQLQQAVHYTPRPLHKLLQKQLEEAAKNTNQEGLTPLSEEEIALGRAANPGELEQLVDMISRESPTILPPSPAPSPTEDTIIPLPAAPKQSNLDQNNTSSLEPKILNTGPMLEEGVVPFLHNSLSGNGGVLSVQPTGGVGQTMEPFPPPMANGAAGGLLQQIQQYVIPAQQSLSQQQQQQQPPPNQALILKALSKQLQQQVQLQQHHQPQQPHFTPHQLQQYLLNQQQQLQQKQQQLELTETLINQQQLQLQLQQHQVQQGKIQPVPNNNLKQTINRQTGIVRPTPVSAQSHMVAMGQVVNGNIIGDLNTPPPSTPMTPNPSPASPQTPLYASLDLDAQTESNHDTALTLACAGGHAELVSLLLSRDADIEHRDKKGFTPLILSATAGHVDVVEILLDHRADIEAQSERTKDTPLSLACSGGRYEVVELLLARGANKEHRNVSDYTPLSLAASGGYSNIIKLLLSHGAEINSRTGSKLGISPLMLAAMNGHTAAVKLLLDMGSDINAQIETNRNTALTLACFQGRHEVVSLLVDRKANIEHRAKTGLTPLMEAASGGYVEVGRVLLDKGADVNAPPVPSSRDTALTIAADKGHYRFVELLLSRGAAVDVKNKKGNSPLWLACNGGHLDVVQLLVQAGADIDSQDNRKVSCLMAAFRKGHIKVVKWMVKHVNQFPSDQECSRYIQTVTDKELQKKCQQCMDIIQSAKDHQAAEANKNASILLEQLDMEKKNEEKRKAAAERRREKRKKKRKEKQEREKEKDSTSKNSSPEPELIEPPETLEIISTTKEAAVVLPPPAPLSATVTTTIGTTLLTMTEAKVSSGKNKVLVEVSTSVTSTTMTTTRSSTTSAVSTPRTNKKKSKSKEKDRPSDSIRASLSASSASSVANASSAVVGSGASPAVGSTNTGTASGNKKKPPPADIPLSPATSTGVMGFAGIGDLDDFGTLPARMKITDKEIAKITKTSLVKGKTNSGGGTENFTTVPQEKGSVNNSSAGGSVPNILSPKTPTVIASPKRGQRKEEGWKEVMRKSKKVNVPASAISRVIGRGGSNINAIREVSGAHIEVEKQKGTTDRVITIKGSADSTRQAHALITALVTDPDKELVEILPKRKLKLLENSLSSPVTNGSSGDINNQSVSGSAMSQRSPAAAKAAGARTPTSSSGGGINAMNHNPSAGAATPHSIMGPGGPVWGGSMAQPPVASPKRAFQRPPGSSAPVGQALERGLSDSSRSQGHSNKKNHSIAVTSTMANVTVTYTMAPSGCNKPVRTSAGGHHMRSTENKPVMIAKLQPKATTGPVKVLQRPNPSASPKPDHYPMRTSPNSSGMVVTANPHDPSATATPVTAMHGQFSPFHNFFSAVAEMLGKKDDALVDNRMNFASVVTSNIPSPGPMPGGLPTSPMTDVDSDLALQAKAPGFKPTRSMSPQFHPDLDMSKIPGYKVSGMSSVQQYGNEPDLSRAPGYRHNIPSPGMSPRSSTSTPSGTSPRGRPGTPGETGPHGMPSAISSQKDEYSTPNQPMTLPKIGSSLNPNAPDFTVRSMPAQAHQVPGGGGPVPNFPPGQMFNNPAANSNLQQLYQQSLKPGLMNPMFGGGMVPPSSFIPPNNMGGGPGADMAQTANQVNMLHRLNAGQNPGPVPMGSGQHGQHGQMMQRAYSPLQPPSTPPSGMSMVGLSRGDGDTSGTIGAPMTASPMRAPSPSTMPTTDQIKAVVEERRMQRPIGTERAQRKAPGPGMNNVDLSTIWGFASEMNNEWMANVSNTSVMASTVMTSSVMTSGVMSAGPGLVSQADHERSVNHVNNPPVRGGFVEGGGNMEQPLEQALQNQGMRIPPNMLSNNLSRQFPPPMYNSQGISGESLPHMWKPSPQMKAPPSESADKMMWNNWNQPHNM